MSIYCLILFLRSSFFKKKFLNKIMGFNAHKERGEIEAEIERKIIIESRKYEEQKHSTAKDETLKDNMEERGSEEK